MMLYLETVKCLYEIFLKELNYWEHTNIQKSLCALIALCSCVLLAIPICTMVARCFVEPMNRVEDTMG